MGSTAHEFRSARLVTTFTNVLKSEVTEIASEQEARSGEACHPGAATAGPALRQQFLGLLEKAPDVEAMLDEQADVWTVVLPPPTDLDAGREIRGSLVEMAAAVTEYLGTRDRLLHAARCAQLDVLRAHWDEHFEVGWDGQWWCESRDGAGERARAFTPDELSRLMGQSVTRFRGGG